MKPMRRISMSKTYELPIAVNYVHNWTVEDAVREILQNAIDSNTDGHKLSITYSNGMLGISNVGVNLDISSLVLGSTHKTDHTKYIGTYGEGYKLALVVLLRNNLGVTIYTKGQMWVPSFKKSTKFKIETLHIEVIPVDINWDQIAFEISGLDVDTFHKLRENSLVMTKELGYSIGNIIETEYGDILLDQRYKSKMFVNGLYVQTDYSFNYGYNFKPEFLPLDRDRKAISYYKARELTAKALTSQSNVQLVSTAIKKSYTDVRYLNDELNSVSKEFRVEFAEYFKKEHNIDDDTFVGLEKEVKVSGKEKALIVDSKVIAELVNTGLGKDQEYAVIKKKAEALTEKEKGWMYYNGSDFKEMVELILANEDKLGISAAATIRNWSSLHTSYFNLIIDDVLSRSDEPEEEDED